MSNLLYDPVRAQAKVSDSVLVAFSGGKDAIVTLDLCCKHFKTVKAFFLYTIKGLEYQENILKRYENIYNIEIYRLPHPDVFRMYRYGFFTNEDSSFSNVSMTEMYDYVREISGIEWIAGGERATDSVERNARIKNSSSIDFKSRRFFPVAYWSKSDIYNYIKVKKLYLPKINKDLGYSPDAIWSDAMQLIKERFPRDYQKIIETFPFYEASLKRYEHYGK